MTFSFFKKHAFLLPDLIIANWNRKNKRYLKINPDCPSHKGPLNILFAEQLKSPKEKFRIVLKFAVAKNLAYTKEQSVLQAAYHYCVAADKIVESFTDASKNQKPDGFMLSIPSGLLLSIS